MSEPRTLKCPVCNSHYAEVSNDPDWLGGPWRVGDVCNNQSGAPKTCTPDTPCPGRLVLADDGFTDPFSDEAIRDAFENGASEGEYDEETWLQPPT